MNPVPINPELLRWARQRAGRTQSDLAAKFERLPDWESGRLQPNLKQLEALARATHTPVGFLFLSEPPEEKIPIPDFRGFTGRDAARPSPNLLDIIYACQERQSWYQEYARIYGESEIDYAGSFSVQTSPLAAAAEMREQLSFNIADRRQYSDWRDGLPQLSLRADNAGILIMISRSVIGDSSRMLDPDEFLGFALCDRTAPLVFINGNSMEASQMFTLAHELAHVWLGVSALSSLGTAPAQGFQKEEVWCSEVAAEFLAPMDLLRSHLLPNEPMPDTLLRLSREFKVSTLIVLRRLLDAGLLTHKRFETEWTNECNRLRRTTQKSSGSGLQHTAISGAGRRFSRALIASTLEGQTLYRDAFRMMGIKGSKTFNSLAREAGVLP